MSKIFPFALVIITLLLGCAKIVCDPTPNPESNPNPNPNPTPTFPAFIQSANQIEDAMVISYYPNINLGDSPKLYTQGWTYNGTNLIVIGFVKFDYSDLKNAKVSKAQLTLFADTTSLWDGSPPPQFGHYFANKSLRIQIKRAIAPWSESTIVYRNRPATVNDKMASSLAATSSSQSFTFDVTGIVKDQISLGNYGFEISLSNFNPYERYAFYSKEGIYPHLYPKIEFEYEK